MTVSAGFFGKIPARGDFVRHGLPSDLVRGLDAWCQAVLPGSRARLGERWTALWMEAPIWRFLLPPGCCGAGAVAGLWLPSTDKAGRLFPLMLAAVAADWAGLAREGGFLDAAEEAGLLAIEQDVAPERLAAAAAAALGGGVPLAPVGVATWWTAGGPHVAADRRELPGMPDVGGFCGMIGGGAS